MAPVYKTHSVDFRIKMEKELIEYFLRQFPNNCQNAKGGGGGPTGDTPYIIYVNGNSSIVQGRIFIIVL